MKKRPKIVKAKRPSWPKEVPILSARDMFKTHYDGPCGTHCLLGWVQEAFPGYFHDKVENAIERTMQESSNATHRKFAHFGIVYMNDAILTKKQAADVWNKAMARLGYTEGNPQAK